MVTIKCLKKEEKQRVPFWFGDCFYWWLNILLRLLTFLLLIWKLLLEHIFSFWPSAVSGSKCKVTVHCTEKYFLLFLNAFVITFWYLKPSNYEIIFKQFLDTIACFLSLLYNLKVIYLVECLYLPWEGERDAWKVLGYSIFGCIEPFYILNYACCSSRGFGSIITILRQGDENCILCSRCEYQRNFYCGIKIFFSYFTVIPTTWCVFVEICAGRIVICTNALYVQELFRNSQLCTYGWIGFLLQFPCSSLHVSCSSFISSDLLVPLCLVPLNFAAVSQWY